MQVVWPFSQVIVLVMTAQPWQTGGGVGWTGFSVTVTVWVTVTTGQFGGRGGGMTVVGFGGAGGPCVQVSVHVETTVVGM